MNSHQTLTHRVARTLDERFAVVTPEGETLAVVCDEFLALRCAADLDAEPVRTVSVGGRWDTSPQPSPLTHRVARTLDGRFAVVTPEGETMAVVCDEFLALRCAADLDAEPVRTVSVGGRWDTSPQPSPHSSNAEREEIAA